MLRMLLILVVLCHAVTTFAVEIAMNGQPRVQIVLSEQATPVEQTAARELQEHLQLVTGAIFENITANLTDAPENTIIVGGEAPGINRVSLGADGIVIKTLPGNRLLLTGGYQRGALYAVYSFLEDIVGIRWWSSTESFIPDKPNLKISYLDIIYTPQILSREAFYRDACNPLHATRLKCNGHFTPIPAEYGGRSEIIGWCHTFFQLLPPDKYFAQHPDWYSEINGTRTVKDGQLCLANDEMRQELTRVALEWIKKSPDAVMISITQNDGGGPCECARCKALETQEGSPAGPLLHFVNAVAKDIEKEFPNILVETLSYQYTRPAPKFVRPRDNVIIRLCTDGNRAEPMATGPGSAKFRHDIEAWSAIAPQLYVWDYTTNFANYLLPYPNHRWLADNVWFFAENKAIGVFIQGDSNCTCSDFPEMRAWLLSHFMWDPSHDGRKLMAEFMNGYYGAAGQPLLKYIDLIDDAVIKSGAILHTSMEDMGFWLDLPTINRATELFDKAVLAVADDAALSRRVARAQMPLDHAWLQRWHAMKRQSQIEKLPFLGPENPHEAMDKFITQAHDFNIGEWREGQPFDTYEPRLRQMQQRFNSPAPLPAELGNIKAEDCADIQDGEFRFYCLGDWVDLVSDEKASDGKAARMRGGHGGWAVQYPVEADFSNWNPVHCYVMVRCEAEPGEGAAFQLGLYNTPDNKDAALLSVPLSEADGEYHLYDLGVHNLAKSWYIWAAPPGDDPRIKAVSIDRMLLVKEPKGIQ